MAGKETRPVSGSRSVQTPSVWEVLSPEAQTAIHRTAVELAQSVPDLKHYSRGLKELFLGGIGGIAPDAVHKILDSGLPPSTREIIDNAAVPAWTLAQSMTQEQRLAFEEAKAIQAHKDQPPTSEKVEHRMTAIDDRNGATCVDAGAASSGNLYPIDLLRSMLGKGTIYECAPMNGEPYIADLKKDPEAARHVYTPPKRSRGSGGVEV